MNLAKNPFRPAFTAAIFAAVLVTAVCARTWVNSDGSKTFEAELKSYNPATGMLVVKSATGADIEFHQDKLSEADIAWLKQEGVKVMAKTPAPVVIADIPDTLPGPDGKEADMTKPVQVYILMGEINMFGFGTIETLKDAVETKKTIPLSRGERRRVDGAEGRAVCFQDLPEASSQRLAERDKTKAGRPGAWHRPHARPYHRCAGADPQELFIGSQSRLQPAAAR